MVNEESKIAHESSIAVSSGYVTKVKGSLAGASEVSSVEAKSAQNSFIDQNTGDLIDPAFVTVDSKNWSRVFVDGKPVGTTPLFKHRVSSGKHIVQVQAQIDAHISTEEVELTAGENRKMNFESK